MRNILLVQATLVALSSSVSTAQSQSSPASTVSYRFGATAFSMSEVRDLMSEGIAFYNSMGVQLRHQREFPANYVHGLEVHRNTGVLRVGAGVAYSNSMAFAGYTDEAGSVRLKATAQATWFYIFVGMEVLSITEEDRLFVSAKIGRLFGSVKSEEGVIFVDFPEYNIDRNGEGKGSSMMVEASAGVTFHPLPWLATGCELGYRFAESFEVPLWNSDMKRKADFDGFQFSIEVGVVLD